MRTCRACGNRALARRLVLDRCGRHHRAVDWLSLHRRDVGGGVWVSGGRGRQLGAVPPWPQPNNYMGYSVMFLVNWIFYCSVIKGLVSMKPWIREGFCSPPLQRGPSAAFKNPLSNRPQKPLPPNPLLQFRKRFDQHVSGNGKRARVNLVEGVLRGMPVGNIQINNIRCRDISRLKNDWWSSSMVALIDEHAPVPERAAVDHRISVSQGVELPHA